MFFAVGCSLFERRLYRVGDSILRDGEALKVRFSVDGRFDILRDAGYSFGLIDCWIKLPVPSDARK